MAKSSRIKVMQCPNCGNVEDAMFQYCGRCRAQGKGAIRLRLTEREKIRKTGEFKVVDWFSSRSSAGLLIEDSEGHRYPIYMSDVFRFLDGMDFGSLTLEETKKGTAYGWRVVDEKEAV